MKYDLAQLARRAGKRRKLIAFRPIRTTKAQADALARIYRKTLTPWDTDRILALYERELQRVMTTDSIDDLGQLFEELGEQLSRLVLELTPDMKDWAFQVESYHRRKWRDTVLVGADVDVTYLIGPQDAQETIDAFLGRNVELVKNVSDVTRGRIADSVYRGIQARTPAREVGKEIAEATGLARKRANRIAADQSVKLSSALDRQRQREAGLDVYKWNHSGKLHPREFHKARDGKLYGEPRTLDGGEVVHPEPKDRPGELPYCGCTAQGVLIIGNELF